MKKVKIAIQGELGAYSHIAVNNLFKDAEVKTCATFEETFKVAFENEEPKIIGPGDIFYVSNTPHDSWVVGDEDYVSIHFMGAEKYAD